MHATPDDKLKKIRLPIVNKAIEKQRNPDDDNIDETETLLDHLVKLTTGTFSWSSYSAYSFDHR